MAEGKFKETEIGLIPEEWGLSTLKEVSNSVTYGYTASACEDKMGPKFLRITDIVPCIIDWNSVPYCEISKKDKSRYILEKGDIVVSRTGANTGFNAIFMGDLETVFASYLIRFKINRKKAFPLFVAYLLKSPYWNHHVQSIIGGSAQPGANAKQFGNFPMPIPSLTEQKQIANILYSLDKKIELNQKMNQTLEEIGQAIFKHWFVHFEFPSGEGKPYKSSGGEMVNSELGEIPKGWNVAKLGDLCEVKGGKRLPKGHKLIEDQTSHPYIRVTDLSDNTVKLTNLQYLNEETFKQISRYVIGKEDLYISIVGTIGLVGLIPKELDGANLTENCAKITNLTKISKEYLFFFLNSSYGQEQIKMLTVGSTQGKLALYRIKEIEIPIPNDQNLLKNVESLFSSFWKTKEHNITQNKFLSNIRDSLLPKLMSGKIRIGE